MTRPTRLAPALLAAVLALSPAGCAHRYPGHLSPRALEERGIRIVGAKVVDPEDVAGLSRCEHEGTPEARCTFDDLWAVYDRRGHPRASFSLRRVADRDGHAMHELVCEEGPAFRVLRVEVEGLEGVPLARAWIPSLPLGVGGPFSAYAFMQVKDELASALRGAGYPEAEVFERMDPDLRASTPGSYAMVARYAVDPGRRGEPWRLGAIVVNDVDPGRKARIRREVEALLREGDPFDYARFVAVRGRLRAFPTAEVLVGMPDERLGKKVLVIVQVR